MEVEWGVRTDREPARRLRAMCCTEPVGLLDGARAGPRREVVKIYSESKAAGFPDGLGVESEWKRRHR